MKVRVLTFVILIAALTGCQSVGKVLITGLVESSKYNPMPVTESDINDYIAQIKSVNKAMVQDELGTYYHEVSPDDKNIFVAKLRSDDGEALKNLFSNSTGVIEPWYSYLPTGMLEPDWDQTAKIHSILTSQLNLKLLPISYSKKYHELLVSHATKAKQQRTSNSAVSNAFTGVSELYNQSYNKNVLGTIGDGFGYIITFETTKLFFNSIALGSDTKINRYSPTQEYSNMKNSSPTISFYPRTFFANEIKGAQFRRASGCFDWDTEWGKRAANYTISQAKQDSEIEKQEMASRDRPDIKRLKGYIAEYKNKYISLAGWCANSYRQMGVSGLIGSRSLR